jgi:hypothetical protein
MTIKRLSETLTVNDKQIIETMKKVVALEK